MEGTQEPAHTRRQPFSDDVGLTDDDTLARGVVAPSPYTRPVQQVRFRSTPGVFEDKSDDSEYEDAGDQPTIAATRRTRLDTLLPSQAGLLRPYRIVMLACVLAIMVPLLHSSPLLGHAGHATFGAKASVIKRSTPVLEAELVENTLARRAGSPTNVCTRWSHQSAIVNSTLYIYGGRASTQAGQTSDTWNNDFLAMDLTKNWQISSPALRGLPQPSGPPSVSNGYLWSSRTSLFMYGGEFSDRPPASPAPFSLWEYNIPSSSWIEHTSPQTSAGDNSVGDGQPIQRAAEGAGITVPQLGRGFYFGGHLDGYTTAGWQQWFPRVYLKSLTEFTFPGYANSAVNTISGGKTAGTAGNWRNITQGGLQEQAGFTERADGLLVYVPGFGKQGILLGLAGGTNATFTQMNVIDVYDIANSTWYKQATSGKTPEIRVNPCATVAAAPDGSSYNVYMYGGQNLIPAGNQTQYNDMWILTVPSFTWIQVNTSKQAAPPARAGHTCNIWNGQMIVVGGYVGDQLSCDSPGVYVFDMSALQWVNQYTASGSSPPSSSSSSSGGNTAGSAAASAGASVSGSSGSGATATASGASSTYTGSGVFRSTSENNPFNQQIAQISNATNSGGLDGSFGYDVPAAVASVIGGASTGGATITVPVQSATSGPLATGRAITYTVTQPNGAIVTETGTAGSGTGSNSSGGGGPNIGAIVAGVIAGILFIIVCYLLFCAWVYRKQLQLYKNHVTMAQRQAIGDPRAEKDAFVLPASFSDRAKNSSEGSSSRMAGSSGIGSAAVGSAVGVPAASEPVSGSVGGYAPIGRRSSEVSDSEDLLQGQEPTFWGSRGVLLNPRRSLRVINRD
ncbi:hypothetical protein LTR04_002607 [Oleoguttula sp. CCFEE 6159]|nr:hypothetical protein LTR04_002607 [Oleoguttula sp. CCFEE 6159]